MLVDCKTEHQLHYYTNKVWHLGPITYHRLIMQDVAQLPDVQEEQTLQRYMWTIEACKANEGSHRAEPWISIICP
jgi:hypothetical protein